MNDTVPSEQGLRIDALSSRFRLLMNWARGRCFGSARYVAYSHTWECSFIFPKGLYVWLDVYRTSRVRHGKDTCDRHHLMSGKSRRGSSVPEVSITL